MVGKRQRDIIALQAHFGHWNQSQIAVRSSRIPGSRSCFGNFSKSNIIHLLNLPIGVA